MSDSACHRWDGDTLVVEVRLQPKASRDGIDGVRDGRLRVRVTAPAVEDAANRRMLKLLADAFGVPKSRVRLVSGHRGRVKRVAVERPARLPAWLE